MNVFSVPIDQWWAFAMYYLPSLGYCALLTISLLVVCLLAKVKQCSRFSKRNVYWPMLLGLLAWVVYFTSTARVAFAVTYLDTEDDKVAERVYKTLFNIDLDCAVKVALDERQTGNVRFYASCRIADLLANKDSHAQADILLQVADSSAFRTGFFGTNDLTCGFFVPNHAEGPFTVHEIIEKRLHRLSEAD